jgi:hypothetical protein
MIVIREHKEAHNFYKEAIELLHESGAEFLLGGAFAVFNYTGLYRDTKDLDVYCRSADCPKILKFFADKGFTTEFTDVRWLAKVFKEDFFMDIIFDTVNNICRVDDSWFERAQDTEFMGVKAKLLAPEELYWSKVYVQNRERYDGADLNHLVLMQGKEMDWEHLLHRMDQHWHLMLSQILLFQFVYPSDYQEIVPRWVFDELIKRANEQYDIPSPVVRVCRGPMIDQTQYSADIKEWDYKSYTIKTV